MANRIPPSLMWLIDKRARIDGEIIRTKKSLRKVEHLVEKLRSLESKLNSIDDSLKLHEIQIEILNIKPIKSQIKKFKFPYGFINQFVMEYLISNINSPPVLKSEIVNSILTRHLEYSVEQITYAQASRAVNGALHRLFVIGRVIKHHPSKTNLEGSWSLSTEMIATHSPVKPKELSLHTQSQVYCHDCS